MEENKINIFKKLLLALSCVISINVILGFTVYFISVPEVPIMDVVTAVLVSVFTFIILNTIFFIMERLRLQTNASISRILFLIFSVIFIVVLLFKLKDDNFLVVPIMILISTFVSCVVWEFFYKKNNKDSKK